MADISIKEIEDTFWSANFDMDLYNAIPQTRDLLKPYEGLKLWTYCSNPTNGRLNHPNVWNHTLGMISFFGTHPYGFKPDIYYTGKDLPFETTLEDAIRDIWVHHCVMLVDDNILWDSQPLWPYFEAMMWRMRKWGDARHHPAQGECVTRCFNSICRAVERVEELLQHA